MGKSLNRFIRKMNIQNRLVISFAILSLIPLLVTGYFAYYTSSKAIKTKISTSSIQLMNQVSENIQNELTKLENDSVDIAFSDIIQNTLIDFHTMDEWKRNDAELKMQSMLAKRFSFNHSVSDVLVYTMLQEKIIAYGDVSFKFNLTSDFLNGIFVQTATNNGVPLWTIESSEDEVRESSYRTTNYGSVGILLTRSFKSFDGIPVGYMIMRIDEKHILKKFKDINLGQGSDIFIINGKGTVISSQNPEMKAAKPYLDQSLIEELKKNKEDDSYSFTSTVSGKRNLIAYNYIPSADWYVISIIPFTYLNDESIKTSIYIIFLGIFCFLLALILSYYVSKSISKPLKHLLNSMNNVKIGNLVTRIEDNSSDELGKVATNFNHMVAEIKYLIDEVTKKEKLKRVAELKTLQAQINPHFLSNSLNTVRWMANIQKAESISSIITSLIQLLHGCMGKGSVLISLQEEMEYVKDYLNIMAFRDYDKFKVHYEMEESIMNFHVPKFILQPIVENCLLHGLEPKEGQGLIIIKGYRIGEDLKIIITDTGIGINNNTLNDLMGESSSNKKHGLSGIGIRNVDERIKLYFGEKYGIAIQSFPNLYTTVEITLPAVGEEDLGKYAEGTYSR
ncbi:cache domain-containing sensor histidine kinase [Paenibacillus anseongense]|uniref:cache domain-containing sensor histidine kinase n=1 Tax=Paenibacillus anseongense TaxID=2682845 RepID=UPI002DBC3FE0|nr:histidine kinase [Paenibacillus anseongense]MEC0270323.1 histidine kinase [Paenibacillus anseongense]